MGYLRYFFHRRYSSVRETKLKRVATGLVLIFVVLYLVLYTSAFWVLGASTLLSALAFYEYNRLGAVRVRDSWLDSLGMLAALSVAPAVFFCGTAAFAPIITGSVFAFFLFGMFRGREFRDTASDVAFKATGLAYAALPFAFLPLIKSMYQGEMWILFLFVIIWANDTLAFAVGKTLGRHKLCPEISPKKTVEGAIGGLAGGAIAAFFFSFWIEGPLWALIVVSIALGIIGIIGDLSESVLKRSAGVKDSGALLPGHGGVLDRVDSLLFAVPALYYYLQLKTLFVGG